MIKNKFVMKLFDKYYVFIFVLSIMININGILHALELIYDILK